MRRRARRLLLVSAAALSALLITAAMRCVDPAAEGARDAEVRHGVPMPAPAVQRDDDVIFTSNDVAIAGSLRLPGAGASPWPAAVILSGSGPIDRNGNSPLAPGPFNTNLNFAEALAADGAASLRYDKLGSGITGLAGRTDPSSIGFGIFVDEAKAAYAFLRGRPEVDSRRVFFLGHSEGALIALAVADQLPAGERPRALVLAAPGGFRYLDIIRRQLTEQYAAAVAAGQVSRLDADAALAELDHLIASLRRGEPLPDTIATAPLRALFNPATARFLAEADAHDPADLIASLGDLPILLLRGGKDQQVSAADIARLEAALGEAGTTRWRTCQPADANHVFKDVPGVPNPLRDYADPALPFSPEAVACLAAFLRDALAP